MGAEEGTHSWEGEVSGREGSRFGGVGYRNDEKDMLCR